jgi:hypothetical protein
MSIKMKNLKPNKLSVILQMLPGNPVMYHPVLARVVGSINAALFLCHLLYWQGKGSKGEWVYKTITDMEDETGLTRTQQDGAIKKLKALKILIVKLRGIPAKRHFQVDMVTLQSRLYHLQKKDTTVGLKPAIRSVENIQTTTESTSEKYTEINEEKLKRVENIKNQIRTKLDSIKIP